MCVTGTVSPFETQADNGIRANINNAAFGTVGSATGNTGSRDFQFSGRINF
jgi:hypothetical protein